MYEGKLKNKILSLFLLCETFCFIYIIYNKELVSDYLGQTITLSEFTIGCVFFFCYCCFIFFVPCFVDDFRKKIIKSRKKVGSVGDLNLFCSGSYILILYIEFKNRYW